MTRYPPMRCGREGRTFFAMWLQTYRYRHIDFVMNLIQLQSVLRDDAAKSARFVLPNGDLIPAHAHVTEVGHVVRNFIDCGGVIGRKEAAVLQTWVGEDNEHRLTSGRLAEILQLGERVLPDATLEVEVEYDCCVVAQYPVTSARPDGDHLDILLGKKQTQCLARERRKTAAESCGEVAGCC